MKFTSEINRDDIYLAVKYWLTGVDGFDGATGGIEGDIPWSEEMEKIVPWDKVSRKFQEAIPSRPYIDMKAVVRGDAMECLRVNNLSNTIADKIVKTYNEQIDELNKMVEYKLLLKRCTGVLNGFAQYDLWKVVSDSTKYGCIKKMISHLKNEYDFFKYENHDYMIDALYNGYSCHIPNTDFYIEFQKR